MFAQFHQFLEDVSDPVYLMDSMGAIRYVNSPARAVLGLETNEAGEGFCLDDCHPQWAAAMIRGEAIPAAIEEGRWRGESALITSDGMELPVFQKIRVQWDDGGDVAHLTSVFTADTGECFEKPRQIDRLTQLETLVRLSKNVLQENCREEVVQRVVEAACELTRGNICLFCRVSDSGEVRVQYASGQCVQDTVLFGELRRLLATPGFVADTGRPRSCRFAAGELAALSSLETSAGKTDFARLRHLVCARLAESNEGEAGLILSGNADNVAFTPEDEVMLLHMAAFTELALHHIHARREAGRRSREMDMIFANLKESVMVCDASGTPVMANPACIDFLGFDPQGYACHRISRLMRLTYPDGTRVFAREMPYARALRGESVIDERYYGFDAKGRNLVYVISSTPLYQEDRITGAVTVWRDETDLEKLTEQLISEQSALQTIIKSAPEGIVVVDKECRITMANPTAVQLYGQKVTYGKPLASQAELKLLYPDGTPFDPRDLPLTRSVFFGEVLIDQEMAVVLPEGGMRYLLVNTTPIKNQEGEIIGGVGVLHDITRRRTEKLQLQQDKDLLERRVAERTAELESLVEALKSEIEERKRVERQLRESRRELRQMSKRTLEALEADKQVIAKELHDSIGASLAAIKFSLEERLSNMKAGPYEDTVSLEKIVSYLIDTIKETKRISAALRPTTLDDLGLTATINWFCREFASFYKKIEVSQDVSIDDNNLPDATKIVIYRILQEAMNNAAKHANPSSIHFALTRKNSAVQMIIQDDGCGFEQNSRLVATDPLSGHGIQSMRERAEICGGQLLLDSRQGRGTRVTLELPL
ncbi:MAG: PAS domain S-box protein [Desulfosalsimonadaceae bacterium]